MSTGNFCEEVNSLSTKEAATTKPNVIVFFTDQQRWDTTGVHDNPLDITPNFDRMAMRGTHVYNSVTCQPVCGPARAVLQTGMYPTTTGCFRNHIPLPEGTRTLAHHFRGAGYTTGYIGKWHLADEEPVTEPRRGGYEYWMGTDCLEFVSDAYEAILYNNDNEPVKLPGYRVDALTDVAIRYIDEHQQEPFFLFISYIEPHHQNHNDSYPAPDGYREKYTSKWMPPDLAALDGSAQQHMGGYCGMIKRLDEALGRLLDTLKSLGLSDNTIIMYSSDHGNHFRTRNKEYKRSPHESSVRVPTAFQGPGFNGGGQIREQVSLIDLPPTLLDAAGIPVPPEMQGRSILPLLHGRHCEDWPQEVLIQFGEDHVGRAIRTKRWKYSVLDPNTSAKQFAGSERYEEQYLYDLECDPYELVNLIDSGLHSGFIRELRETLLRRMEEAGESRPEIVEAPRKMKKERYAHQIK
jgi:arylsulfatase A-like enzyme